jgi:hypothetical protein
MALSRVSTGVSSQSYETVAFSVARLTLALPTPGTFLSARSTRETQDAQVMPPTPMVRVSVRGESGV